MVRVGVVTGTDRETGNLYLENARLMLGIKLRASGIKDFGVTQDMADIDAYKDKFSESGQRVLETRWTNPRNATKIMFRSSISSRADNEEADLFNSTMRDLAVDPRTGQIADRKANGNGDSTPAKVSHRARNDRAFQTRDGPCAFARSPRDRCQRHFLCSFKRRTKYFSMTFCKISECRPKKSHKRRARDSQARKRRGTFAQKYELPSFLRHFGVSMNKLARQDKIPPTIGREKEILR